MNGIKSITGHQFLLDTNILIYFFNKIPPDDYNFLISIFNSSFNISCITTIEFLGWHQFKKDPYLLAKARDFISHANILYIDALAVEKSVTLKQDYSIKTPDAIIAATALVNNFILLTANEEDFTNLPLQIINPYKREVK